MNHKQATQLAAQSTCELCERPSCVPAHFPRHRGSGGRFENDWDQEHWVPLCGYCHDLIDGRQGVSKAKAFERELAIERLTRRNDE